TKGTSRSIRPLRSPVHRASSGIAPPFRAGRPRAADLPTSQIAGARLAIQATLAGGAAAPTRRRAAPPPSLLAAAASLHHHASFRARLHRGETRMTYRIAPLALILLASWAAHARSAEQSGPPVPLLMQKPTVNKTHVVFSYADDLWIVPREGGEAK